MLAQTNKNCGQKKAKNERTRRTDRKVKCSHPCAHVFIFILCAAFLHCVIFIISLTSAVEAKQQQSNNFSRCRFFRFASKRTHIYVWKIASCNVLTNRLLRHLIRRIVQENWRASKKKRLILRANTAIFVWCGKSLPICAGKMSQKRTSKKIIESIEGKRSKEGKTHSNVMMTMMENERRIKSTTAFYFALSNKNVISYIRFYCTIYILVRLLNSIMASCMIQLSLPGCWLFVRSFFLLIFALAIGLGVPMLHRMASSPLYGKAKRKQQE